jgi:acyl-CoA carboxylase subunit alpha
MDWTTTWTAPLVRPPCVRSNGSADPTTLAEAGSLVAPMPGAVVRIEVIQGTRVEAGTPIVVLEAMTMEHTVRAPADGVVATISVAAGDQVESSQVLAVVSADE